MCHWVGVCVPTSSSVKTGVGIERALALPPSQVIIGWDPRLKAPGVRDPDFQLAPGGGGEEEVEKEARVGLGRSVTRSCGVSSMRG